MGTKREAFGVKTVVVFIVLIIVVAMAAKFLLAKKEVVDNAPTALKPPIAVKLAMAQNEVLVDKKTYLVSVNANKSINISSKLSGYIQNVYVKEDDFVKKGTLLLKIDSAEIQSNIDSLKSSLNAMKKDQEYKILVYERNQKLYEKKALSKEKLDLSSVALSAISASIETTTQKINSLVNQLEYLNIKAPFDGVISNVLSHKGDLAVPNKPLIKLNSKKQKLIFTFSDNKVKKGLDVYVDGVKKGKIKTIYDDARNGLKVAEVALDQNVDATNGERINADVVFKEVDGCVVDNRAILYKKNTTQVVIYKDNAFNFMDVDVLLMEKEKALISPCPDVKVAISSQSKLSILPQYKDVKIIEAK